MQTVTISPKFQVVIPKSIREALHLIPGERLQVFIYQKRLEFMLVRDVKKMRGALKGMSTTLTREKDRL
ncbi:MAG TPA: AbrB/MazE/SpoVT family DNA-binding domain-containing protein [Coxiellaceae bacterium]|nr:MAG: AbrB family transcriptional regulator [Gammaproteobacteria bacterium RIFCSPHIGHO2_12_FULL_36_30]HLB57031.1 AbrB/MazE/SpoVT family DNA-binding domain-containing protein [Coxiellaceae bacterium]